MKTYSLTGKIIDNHKNVITGAHVLAFDNDFLRPGDLLGDVKTDSNGLFKKIFYQDRNNQNHGKFIE
jgi:hypothetical protein